MSISNRILFATIAIGLSAPAFGEEQTFTVIGTSYEQRGGVVASGVSLGVTDPVDNLSAGLMLDKFTWSGNPVSAQHPPEGAAFIYLAFSVPHTVAPYVELGVEPGELLLAMLTDNYDGQTRNDTANKDQWDHFVTLGVKARLGRHASLGVYHRWYEVYRYDPQTDANDALTKFHVWGGAFSIFF